MTKNHCFLIFFILLSDQSFAIECTQQWITGSAAILKSYQLPMNLHDPEGDAHKRMRHGDYRFISIGEVGPTYPGVQSSSTELICKLGFQFIEGTSDGFDGREHMQLQIKFTDYAAEFNKTIAGAWAVYWEEQRSRQPIYNVTIEEVEK